MPLPSLVVIVCRGKEWVIEPLQFPYIIYVYDLHDWKLKLICLFISWFWCSHHITNISRCIISFLSWKICTMLMFPSCYEQVLGDSIFHLKLSVYRATGDSVQERWNPWLTDRKRTSRLPSTLLYKINKNLFHGEVMNLIHHSWWLFPKWNTSN